MEKSKTCTLYKYVSTNHLESIIEKQRLRISNGDDFNDPFEMKYFDLNSNKEIKVNNYKVLCLTNTYKNKLMWSHYADKYRGCCLTIQLPIDDIYALKYTNKKVTNKNARIITKKEKDYAKKNLKKEYPENIDKIAVLVKDRIWSYEREYRLVLPNDDLRIIEEDQSRFVNVKITRIYIGFDFDSEKNARVIDLCRDNNIPISKVYRSDNDYTLRVSCFNKEK